VRAARRLPADMRDLLEKFTAAVDAVEVGTLDPKQATAMAALGNVILKFYETAQMETALQELQDRLATLERERSG
jgi:hypothetical protein